MTMTPTETRLLLAVLFAALLWAVAQGGRKA